MARIVEHFQVQVSPAAAFAYIADFTNTREWDPQIDTAVRRDDGLLRVGSAFEVGLRLGSRTVPLVYTITELILDEHVVLETSGPWYRGRDDVRVRPATDGSGGSEVQWDATFALRGPLALIDPLLAVGFRRTGTMAVAGLRAALSALADEEQET
jgi:hypothetical protein